MLGEEFKKKINIVTKNDIFLDTEQEVFNQGKMSFLALKFSKFF